MKKDQGLSQLSRIGFYNLKPEMPVGSPGMKGGFKDDYAVMVFDSKGKIHFYEMR